MRRIVLVGAVITVIEKARLSLYFFFFQSRYRYSRYRNKFANDPWDSISRALNYSLRYRFLIEIEEALPSDSNQI